MALTNTEIKKIEKKIGYKFSNYQRLEEALTHISRQALHQCPYGNYERLEFLGDLVLGLAVGELLFETFPKGQEGELSIRMHALVNGATCCKIAKQLGLLEFIKVGGEFKSSGGGKVEGILADVFESLIAAIYLDGGMVAVKPFIKKVYKDIIAKQNIVLINSKTTLLKWGHRQGYKDPVYTICNRQGPCHEPSFTVEVCVGEKHKAKGQGSSKRGAETKAATNLLTELGVWKNEK